MRDREAWQNSDRAISCSETAVHVSTHSHAASPLSWRPHWLGSASSLLREEALYPRRQWHPSVAARSSRPLGRDRAPRRQVIQLPPHNSVPNESLGRQLSAHGTARADTSCPPARSRATWLAAESKQAQASRVSRPHRRAARPDRLHAPSQHLTMEHCLRHAWLCTR